MTATRVLYAVTDPVTALSFLRGQLAFLKSEGFEPHLACARTPALEDFAEAEGVVLHDVPLSRRWLSGSDLMALVRAVRVLRAVRPQVLNYSTPKAALVWSVASWFSRPPLVVFLLRGLRLEGESAWSPGFVLLWVMELFAARSAHVTVCVSHSLRARAARLGLVSQRKSVVLGAGSSNGVDSKRFIPVARAERENARWARDLEADALVVGYVGRFAVDKGIDDLLDAVQMCVREGTLVRCVLAGAPEPNYDLNRSLERRPDTAKVTSVRPATHAVEAEYAAFDVFVLPSHREGLSNALLEAQARGLPCVTTDATGCADAIAPGESGFVVPAGEPEALAEAIMRFAGRSGRELASSMGQLGRRRVERHFEPLLVWREYADLYRRGLAASTKRSSSARPSNPGVTP